MPVSGGVVLATSDGGRSWHAVATPANAQTVCFSDPRHGWLGAGGLLYRTSDGGKDWTALTSMAGALGSGYPAEMSVECASGMCQAGFCVEFSTAAATWCGTSTRE